MIDQGLSESNQLINVTAVQGYYGFIPYGYDYQFSNQILTMFQYRISIKVLHDNRILAMPHCRATGYYRHRWLLNGPLMTTNIQYSLTEKWDSCLRFFVLLFWYRFSFLWNWNLFIQDFQPASDNCHFYLNFSHSLLCWLASLMFSRLFIVLFRTHNSSYHTGNNSEELNDAIFRYQIFVWWWIIDRTDFT